MTDDQTTRLPSGYRPRRVPSLPRITEQDRPDPIELQRVRESLAGKPKPRPKGCW